MSARLANSLAAVAIPSVRTSHGRMEAPAVRNTARVKVAKARELTVASQSTVRIPAQRVVISIPRVHVGITARPRIARAKQMSMAKVVAKARVGTSAKAATVADYKVARFILNGCMFGAN